MRLSLKLENILIYLAWTVILIFVITHLFNMTVSSIIWSVWLAFLIFLYHKFDDVPAYMHLLIAIIIISNIIGETTLSFFYSFVGYDKVLHLINPIIISVFVYHAVKRKIKTKTLLVLFCVFATLSFGAFWEISEYFKNIVFGSVSQGVYIAGKEIVSPLDDTMRDMTYNLAGTIIFALGYYFYNKRRMLKTNNKQNKKAR